MTPCILRTLSVCIALVAASTGVIGADAHIATSNTDVVCSFAPSQSKAVGAISGAAGGAAATTTAIASALGLSVVTHSSGALILAGSGGYIAGTLGAAIVAPAVIAVGVVVGGTALTVELFCSPKNHPKGYGKVIAAAAEFGKRTGSWIQDAKDGMANAAQTASSFSSVTITSVKDKTSSLYEKIFKKS